MSPVSASFQTAWRNRGVEMGEHPLPLPLPDKEKEHMGATRGTKIRAKRMYEKDGLTFAAIGREVGFGGQAVSKWSKEDGWVKAGVNAVSDRAAEMDAEALALLESATPAPEPVGPDRSELELRERLAVLEERNRALEDENKDLKPTYDIGGMFTDRVKWLTDNSPEGERYWIDRAEAEYKKVNIERALQGLPGFDVKDHPEILDDHINRLKTTEAMLHATEPDEPASRKVKLFIMRNGMPTLEQIPMENQINNMAGSLADGIVRYTQKGFKLTDPFLCPRAGCWKDAGVDAAKRWSFDGYCTDKHREQVEGSQKSPTVGLQTRDVMVGV